MLRYLKVYMILHFNTLNLLVSEKRALKNIVLEQAQQAYCFSCPVKSI